MISRILYSGAWTISPERGHAVVLEELVDHDDGEDVVAQLGERPGHRGQVPVGRRGRRCSRSTAGARRWSGAETRDSSCSRAACGVTHPASVSPPRMAPEPDPGRGGPHGPGQVGQQPVHQHRGFREVGLLGLERLARLVHPPDLVVEVAEMRVEPRRHGLVRRPRLLVVLLEAARSVARAAPLPGAAYVAYTPGPRSDPTGTASSAGRSPASSASSASSPRQRRRPRPARARHVSCRPGAHFPCSTPSTSRLTASRMARSSTLPFRVES